MELRWPICLFRCCEDDPFLQCSSRVKRSLNVKKCARWEALNQARAVFTKRDNTSLVELQGTRHKDTFGRPSRLTLITYYLGFMIRIIRPLIFFQLVSLMPIPG